MLGLGLGLTAVRRPPAGTILLGPNFLSPLLTFARASGATDTDAAGNVVVYGEDVPRYGYDAGIGGWLLEGSGTNLALGSAALASQSVAVTAQPYVLSFRGTGSVALSGAYTGTLNGTGATNRVRLPFTPAAGTLTLTVTGQVLGAQLEAGTVATSYIPTTDTPANRAPDSMSITGSALASLFGAGAPQGCVIFDVVLNQRSPTTNPFICQLDDGTINNRLYLYNVLGAQLCSFACRIDGVFLGNAVTANSFDLGSPFRIGARWGDGRLGICMKGGSIASQTIAIPGGLNTMRIGGAAGVGGSPLNGRISLAAILPYAPGDAEFKFICTPGAPL